MKLNGNPGADLLSLSQDDNPTSEARVRAARPKI